MLHIYICLHFATCISEESCVFAGAIPHISRIVWLIFQHPWPPGMYAYLYIYIYICIYIIYICRYIDIYEYIQQIFPELVRSGGQTVPKFGEVAEELKQVAHKWCPKNIIGRRWKLYHVKTTCFATFVWTYCLFLC